MRLRLRRWQRALTLMMGIGLVFAAPVLSGCRRQTEEAAEVYGLRVEDLRGVSSSDADWARASLERALQGARTLRPRPSGGPVLGANIWVGEVRTASGAVLRVEVELQEPSELDARLGTGLDATVELERADGTVDLHRDLPVALERAVAVLDAKIVLARDEPEGLVRLLGDEDPEIVLLALEHVTRKRQRERIDEVLPLLRHPQPRVAQAAVKCVGQIGAPEHAPALVEAARLADREHTGELYEALARVGGPEAVGFLAFASRNEDDPALAEVARRALALAQRRRGQVHAAEQAAHPMRGHR